MAKVELELERLAQIQEVMGAKLPEIVGGMVESMTAAIEQVEVAMQVSFLPTLQRTSTGAQARPRFHRYDVWRMRGQPRFTMCRGNVVAR